MKIASAIILVLLTCLAVFSGATKIALVQQNVRCWCEWTSMFTPEGT